jgi:MFS family permease
LTARSDPYRALRYGDFRWLLVATTLASIASQMQSLVLGWQVYELTHDALALGWMGLAEALPFLGLTLVGGLAADRWNRRVLAVASTALSLLGALVLLMWFRYWHRHASTWPLYAVQSLAGVSRAFSRPATQALGAELVPRSEYQNASTWRSACFHFSMVAGPAIGGLLFAWGGSLLAFKVIASLLAAGAVCMLIVRGGNTHRALVTSHSRGLVAGVRFVFAHRLILSALSLDLFAVLFGGAIALLPAFASDILHVGPEGLGLLRTAPAVGAIGMSLVLAYRPPNRRAGAVLLAAVAVFGACWILIAFSRTLAWSVALLALSGAVDDISVVLRATLVQTHTPADMMGRVQAVNGFFIGSSNEIGAFESGLTAKALGLVPSVVFGGCMTLVVVAAVAYLVPELRRLKHITDPASE